jgi:diaminohydroxyphosphoribosylaminopyrimidine deaminase / 5-amino-6-(5-phosphoribosylamino)uracil reductase
MDQELTHGWRADEDAILVGRKTVEIDNPTLTVRAVEGKNPIRIVIDPKQVLSRDKSVFNDQAPTIILATEGPEQENTIILPTSDTWLQDQMNNVLALGIGSMIVEGGAHTLQEFIRLGLWDEARILTGASTFGAGTPAPAVEGTLREDFIIGPDKVQVYSKA